MENLHESEVNAERKREIDLVTLFQPLDPAGP